MKIFFNHLNVIPILLLIVIFFGTKFTIKTIFKYFIFTRMISWFESSTAVAVSKGLNPFSNVLDALSLNKASACLVNSPIRFIGRSKWELEKGCAPSISCEAIKTFSQFII